MLWDVIFVNFNLMHSYNIKLVHVFLKVNICNGFKLSVNCSDKALCSRECKHDQFWFDDLKCLLGT